MCRLGPTNRSAAVEAQFEPEESSWPEKAGKVLLTEAETSRFLRVSRVAILKFRRDPVDPIPCFKIGRRYLYDPAEILRWAKRQAARAQKDYGRRGRF